MDSLKSFGTNLQGWYNSVNKRVEVGTALYEYPTNAPAAFKSQIHILSPMIDIDTKTHDDIATFLTKVYVRMREANVPVCVVYGDEQLIALMWKLICEDPDNYLWLFPFPGDFHFLIHITHALYRLFPEILIDLATVVKNDKIKIDFLSKDWYLQEDHMFIVIEAITMWLQSIKNFPKNKTVASILQDVKNNLTVYNLLYFYFHYGNFYFNLRQAIRCGQSKIVNDAWTYSWPLFHVTNKYHYAKLSVISSYCTNFAHLAIQEAINDRFCNMKGIAGHCIAPDMTSEKVCNSFRTVANFKFATVILFWRQY